MTPHFFNVHLSFSNRSIPPKSSSSCYSFCFFLLPFLPKVQVLIISHWHGCTGFLIGFPASQPSHKVSLWKGQDPYSFQKCPGAGSPGLPSGPREQLSVMDFFHCLFWGKADGNTQTCLNLSLARCPYPPPPPFFLSCHLGTSL